MPQTIPMNLRYRLAAIDIDGTLLNTAQQVPARNLEALRKAHAAGMELCLCTGRSLTETLPVAESTGLALRYAVLVFGAIVADLRTGQTLSRATLADDLTAALVDHFRSRGYPILLLYDVSEAGLDYRVLDGERNAAAYRQWLEVAPTRAEWCRQLPKAGPQPIRIGIIEAPEGIEQAIGEVRSEFPATAAKINAIYAPNYGFHVIECFAPQVNKWHGISVLCDRLGIAGSQVVAIGDDVNDVEMIAQAGLGVAMGNAVEAVRAVARRQVPDNNACGLAVLLEDLLAG